jgi:hypothetical protein
LEPNLYEPDPVQWRVSGSTRKRKEETHLQATSGRSQSRRGDRWASLRWRSTWRRERRYARRGQREREKKGEKKDAHNEEEDLSRRSNAETGTSADHSGAEVERAAFVGGDEALVDDEKLLDQLDQLVLVESLQEKGQHGLEG